MIEAYVPVLLLVGFVVFNAILLLGLSALTLRARPSAVKQMPYESGIPPLGSAHERFSIKFYMVAISFIIFDVETVFLIPWGVQYRKLSCLAPLVDGSCPAGQSTAFGFLAMLIFVTILAVGLLYEWKKGALQWD